MSRPISVLILCTGNSARSILGEAILDHLGAPRFAARSAGSSPKGAPHPQALARLAAEGLRATGWSSKSWDVFAGHGAPAIDIVITVCDSAAGETCPWFPGAPVSVHWGMPDPAAAPEADQPAAFKATFDALRDRIEALIALPLETMTPEARKAALEALHHARP